MAKRSGLWKYSLMVMLSAVSLFSLLNPYTTHAYFSSEATITAGLKLELGTLDLEAEQGTAAPDRGILYEGILTNHGTFEGKLLYKVEFYGDSSSLITDDIFMITVEGTEIPLSREDLLNPDYQVLSNDTLAGEAKKAIKFSYNNLIERNDDIQVKLFLKLIPSDVPDIHSSPIEDKLTLGFFTINKTVTEGTGSSGQQIVKQKLNTVTENRNENVSYTVPSYDHSDNKPVKTDQQIDEGNEEIPEEEQTEEKETAEADSVEIEETIDDLKTIEDPVTGSVLVEENEVTAAENIHFASIDELNNQVVGLPNYLWEWLEQEAPFPDYVEMSLAQINEYLQSENFETLTDENKKIRLKLNLSQTTDEVSLDQMLQWLTEKTTYQTYIEEISEGESYVIILSPIE